MGTAAPGVEVGTDHGYPPRGGPQTARVNSSGRQRAVSACITRVVVTVEADDARGPDDSGAGAPSEVPRGALASIGAACARRHWIVIGLWLLALLATGVARNAAGGAFSDKVELSGTQAYSGLQLLNAHEPAAGGYAGQIVFHVPSGSVSAQRDAIESSLESIRGLAHVRSVSDPFGKGSTAVSADGRTAYSTVSFDVRPKTLGHDYVGELEAATQPARQAGVEVEYGGGLDELFRPAPNDALSELIGFAVALVVLLVGFASVAAAVLPLATALIAVIIAVGILALVAGLITFGTTAPTLALMIGLGVGIDYALFLTTRFRQRIMDGQAPVGAAAFTVATSGHAVLVAAGTVALALLGLYASGITFIGQLGLAAMIAVAVAAAAAMTLVPAGLGLLGRSIDRFCIGKPVAEAGSDSDHWHRYAATIARRPWTYMVLAIVVLAILTIPLLSIELGHIDDGADPSSYTDHRAYALVAGGFGPGANAPFTVVVDTSQAHAEKAAIAHSVETAVKQTPGVASSTPLSASKDGAILVGKVISANTPQSRQTRALFEHLVDTTLPQALAGTGAHGYVAGLAASQLQFRDTVTARLPVVIAIVVGLAFLLLMATFRSVLVALKAAILNLLSVGAAYGVIVAVFQWGWGGSLLGVHEKVPIESYVPVLMFAIIFGLSMDYEVFLLSRIKEAWDRSHDNTGAVAAGLASTARVISCAAVIMASVFLSFVLSSSVVVKMLAVGLSASVLVDATVVRLVLVPATMTLLGEANWWMPRWLDRVLPRISAEGAAAG
jgi:RND superfamily putative drug exporter